MRTYRAYFYKALVLLLTLLMPIAPAYAAPSGAVPPGVTTQAASSIASDGATLNATVSLPQADTLATCAFAWGTGSALTGGDTATTSATCPAISVGTGPFLLALGSLSAETTYYFRAFAVDLSAASGYGSILSFTTSAAPVSAPTVATDAASDITSAGATENGSITLTGGADVTEHGFAYSTDSSLSANVSTSTLGSFTGTGSFTDALSGLSPSTTYYYRAYGMNSGGTGYGSIQTLTTSAASAWSKANDTSTGGVVGDYYHYNIPIPTVTAGNLLVAILAGPTDVTSVTGGGVTWIQALDRHDSSRLQIWYGLNSSGASSPTIAFVTAGGSIARYNIAEFSWAGGDTDGASIEAGTAGLNSNSAQSATSMTGSITPTAGLDALMLSASTWGTGADYVSGPASGWTNLAGSPGSTGVTYAAAWRTEPSTSGSYSNTWVYSNQYNVFTAAIVAIRAAAPCGFGLNIGGGQCRGYLTATGAGSWTVPSDWSDSNTIEVIGAGGDGAKVASGGQGGGGGGGGAYAKRSNIIGLSGSIPYSIAAGGSGADTWFNSISTVLAKPGSDGSGRAGGSGGAAGSSIGDTVFSGGAGGDSGSGSYGGGGGGGAAGPEAGGASGGSDETATGYVGGSGGGGADDGQPGDLDVAPAYHSGGSGGKNRNGTGGGTGGNDSALPTAGTDGGGGGGGGQDGGSSGYQYGADGGAGTEWDSTHGAGGGGGGGNAYYGSTEAAKMYGGAGALYGGGGGGGGTSGSSFGDGGSGGQGLIVITYTPNAGSSGGSSGGSTPARTMRLFAGFTVHITHGTVHVF